MNIQQDIPFEVTESQYIKLMTNLAGVVAGRKDEDGVYWIKVWGMRYINYVESILTN